MLRRLTMQKKGAALRAALKCEPSQDRGAAEAPDRGPEHVSGGSDASANLPDRLAFTPVPRRYRHDGWTPERQGAFIHALADTGCVDRAARVVNIAQANFYAVPRAAG